MLVEISNVAVPLDAMLPGNEDRLLRDVAKAVGVKPSVFSPLISLDSESPLPKPGDKPEEFPEDVEFLDDVVLCGERIGLLRRSVDARKKGNVHFVITVLVDIAGLDDEGIGAERALERLGKRARRGVGLKHYQAYRRLNIPDVGDFHFAGDFKRPVIVGAGPAGLFAGLYLAQAGMRPIIVERGKQVEQRMRDIESFAAGGELDVNSNVQFGEGGAGTFSDGKLNTGIKSPYIRHVLREFAHAGAPREILISSKPHIGTDLLPGVVRNIRKSIERMGGTFLFSTQFVGFGASDDACGVSGYVDAVSEDANAISEEADGRVGLSGAACSHDASDVIEFEAHPGIDVDDRPDICGLESEAPLSIGDVELLDLETGVAKRIDTDTVVLAIGHSARDTYGMLASHSIALERKPFAMGVRIEHLQNDIDKAQYGDFASHPLLGAADYKLAVRDDDGRGVYTFCMCPGGSVVCASSEPGGVCVNGMSAHARDGENANSALLVEVRPEDLPGDDVFAGIALQREVERSAYSVACQAAEDGDSAGHKVCNGRNGREAHGIHGACGAYKAPAQTVGDFMAGGFGAKSRKVTPTYPRGVVWCDLHDVLPPFISGAIHDAIPKLDRKLAGFGDSDAVMTGVEARSSSPVRIIRDRTDLQSVSIAGLYPAGEGAGYAGGIMSAAVDGIRVAEKIVSAFADKCRIKGRQPSPMEPIGKQGTHEDA